jgi:hypothetical protein
MIKKKITVNIDSSLKYLQIWNGIFNLTDKGLKILATFIDVQLISKEENFCSVKNKKKVASIIGLKDYNTLNNYVKRFKDKGVVIKNNNVYHLNNFLNPETTSVEVTINRV